MGILTFRTLTLATSLVIALGPAARCALAQASPVGTWTGVVSDQQRNVAVTLTVSSLRVNAQNGEMRWGAPRACSLWTEYTGMRGTQYSLAIAGSNDGWCDLYRDGVLLVDPTTDTPAALAFNLADKNGGGVMKGQLAPAP